MEGAGGGTRRDYPPNINNRHINMRNMLFTICSGARSNFDSRRCTWPGSKASAASDPILALGTILNQQYGNLKWRKRKKKPNPNLNSSEFSSLLVITVKEAL